MDNPFFDKVPGVKRYANWKVLGEKLGTVAFTHYDLLELDDLDAWERGLRESKATEICPGWTKRWSVHGTDEQYAGLNFQVMLCEEIAAPDCAQAGERR